LTGEIGDDIVTISRFGENSPPNGLGFIQLQEETGQRSNRTVVFVVSRIIFYCLLFRPMVAQRLQTVSLFQ